MTSARTGHRVEWVLVGDGNLSGKVTCWSVGKKPCRATCPDGCESFTQSARRPDYDEEGHRLEFGDCQACEYLNDWSGVLDGYAGPPHEPRNGRIDVEWNYDGYWSWRYVS